MVWEKLHMELNNFLLALNKELKAKNLKFVVIRNYEELPVKNLGNHFKQRTILF